MMFNKPAKKLIVVLHPLGWVLLFLFLPKSLLFVYLYVLVNVTSKPYIQNRILEPLKSFPQYIFVVVVFLQQGKLSYIVSNCK